MPDEIRALGRDDLEGAAALLARAFRGDPLIAYLTQDVERPLGELLPTFFRFPCEVRLRLDWPLLGRFQDGALAGVAGVTLPEDADWPPALEAVYRETQDALGRVGTRRLEAYAARVDAERPSAPNHMLGVLGVDPEAQGRGHGRALLDAVQALAEAHPRSTGVWLDTESERSAAFYRRCGFEEVSRTEVDGLPIWCLMRVNAPGTVIEPGA